MHRVHQEEPSREEFVLDLDAIAREGAKRMLAQALEAEVEIYLETTRGERDEQGRAKAAPWWCATVTPGDERSSVARVPSRLGLQERWVTKRNKEG